MEKIQLKQGDLYKDYRGNVYRIVAVAEYKECNETIVVYQEMFPNYQILAMSLEGFVAGFSKWQVVEEKEESERKPAEEASTDGYPEGVNPLLIDFLEADTIHEKVKLLIDNREKVDDKCINDLAASLDISIEEGDLEVRYYQLVSCLETMRKYEILR